MDEKLKQNIAKTLEQINPRMTRGVVASSRWTVSELLSLIADYGKTIDPRFVIDEKNEEVYTNLAYWAMGDSRMTAINPLTGEKMPGRIDKGLYLAGNIGTGKTTAMQILHNLYRLNPYRKPWAADSVCNNRIVRAASLVSAYETEGYAGLNEIERSEYLIIEDLGTEPIEAVFMGNRRHVIKQLLEKRGDIQSYVTSVTSNIPLGHTDFSARYGARAQSRAIDMMNYLILKGDDRRKNL